MIMLFFAVCGAWILAYLNNSKAGFKIAGGIILFFVALDMMAAKRQACKRAQSTGDTAADGADSDNLALYPLAIPLLVGPSAFMSVIVVNAGFAGMITCYVALIAVIVKTGNILYITVVAEGWLNEKIKRYSRESLPSSLPAFRCNM